MKNRLFIIFFIPVLAASTPAFGQGFVTPANGKAVIYFARVTTMGFGVSFEYFHHDHYLGAFKGKGYLRYECDPGQQLFWVSSENKEFLTADMKDGGTYLVIVDVAMGIGKARVGLTPITDRDQKLFERARELIQKEAPEVTSQEKIDKMNEKLKGFISDKLRMYEDKWKGEKHFANITANMALSDEAMK